MTSKEYMSCVTAIEGEWLAELGPMFFSVKESYKTRLLQRAKEKDQRDEMEKQMFIADKRKEYDLMTAQKEKATVKRSVATPGVKATFTKRIRIGL